MKGMANASNRPSFLMYARALRLFDISSKYSRDRFERIGRGGTLSFPFRAWLNTSCDQSPRFVASLARPLAERRDIDRS